MGTAIYIPKRPVLKFWALLGLGMIAFSYLFTLAVAAGCVWLPRS